MTYEAVSLKGVSRRYGKQLAAADLDLSLSAGECVGLVGHNGAGKSTMIKMMLGLVAPTSGHIAVLGANPIGRDGAVAHRRLGYLPENVALHPAMTAVETLAFYARLKGEPASRNLALLERVGLADAANKRIGAYSKGMRQRLGLAQAMLGRPRVLLLDEPTSGLDPELRHSFYEIIDELRRDGAMVLLSSHALAELEGKVDRVVVMNRGRKVADGTIATLRTLAAMSPRVRLRPQPSGTTPDDAIWVGWTPVADGLLERTVAEDDLTGVLTGLPATAREIDIIRPSLDDLYASFQKEIA